MDHNLPPVWRLSLQGWFSLLALGLVLWLLITYAGLILQIIFILFSAILISLAIRPLANALARWHVPHGVTVLGVYVGLLGLLVTIGTLLTPMLGLEVTRLQANGPTLIQKALSQLAALPGIGRQLPSFDTLAQTLSQRLDTLITLIIKTATGAGELILDLIVILILAYFFTTDISLGQRLLLHWIPSHYQPQAQVVRDRLRRGLTRWIWAQIAIAVYFALVFSIGLSLLGIPFAITIGVVGGVLEIIPYVGGIVALLLAILSALTVDPFLALWVILLYLVVTEVETHIIAPSFYGRAMGLRPAVVLIALLVGAKANGVLGVLFAVPVAIVLAALSQEVQMALITGESNDKIEDKGRVIEKIGDRSR